MGKLVYSAITSLDGYVADEDGDFDWAAPDEEVHAFVNDLERPIGTYLYGRRMYEVMVAWETMPTSADQPAAIARLRADLAGGRQGRLLHDPGTVSSARTRIERDVRPRRGPRAEGAGGARHQRRRARPRGQRAHGRAGRRVPPVRQPGRRRRRHAVPARRCAARPRSARRAPLRQRRRAPALPGAPLSPGAVSQRGSGWHDGHQYDARSGVSGPCVSTRMVVPQRRHGCLSRR